MWLTALVVTALLRIAEGQWWSNAVYYRMLVDSFRDGDDDGLGNLKGATKQLSYIRAVGADAIILSPISARSTDCTKPGTVDFSEVDQRYGNLDNFVALLEKAKKIELKVLITLSMQSVSVDSAWFKSSVDQVAGFEDWIVWKDGTADVSPEEEDNINWPWHETRKAYWANVNSEAMVNLCSESVSAELSAAQCAWLRRGVSGVLLNPDFPPNIKCGEKLLKKLAADAINCARSANMETPVILVESSLPPESASMYYGDGGVGANSVLSQALTSQKQTAAEFGIAFHSAMLSTPEDATPAWVTSRSNESRIVTRYGSNMVDTINLLALILPGAAVIQQGDELGTADTILEWVSSTTCWPIPPNPAAAPFPWDDTANAGFSTVDPWMPPAPNYRYANAKTEYANDISHLGVVKLTAAMRKSPALGPHTEIKRLNGALAVMRWGGHGTLILVSNVGREPTEAQVSKLAGLPTEVAVVASSAGSALTTGAHHTLERTLKLAPGESVLLAGGPRHCGGPGPVDKIANKLSEGWQKINKYFSNM